MVHLEKKKLPPTRLEMMTQTFLELSGNESTQLSMTRCPKGHMTHNFLSCDRRSGCWDSKSQKCSAEVNHERQLQDTGSAELFLSFELFLNFIW